MIDVSIVIVCMNNLKNLYPCLESIRKFTPQTTYETFVVAYLFSQENLEKLKADFPWVTFIESNEIRGFSENNNLALRQARGKYCFVLNDDTEMKMPVIDKLVETIESLPEDVAVVSPRAIYGNGDFQSCGRDVHTTWKSILSCLHLYNERRFLNKFKDAKGVFETGDVVGAFFLIKTDVFKQIGFFDERFFFCPEDLAVGYELRKRGLKHYVNADVVITHYEGMSGGKTFSKTRMATAPSGNRGKLIFYSHGNDLLYVALAVISALSFIPNMTYHYIRGLFQSSPNTDQMYAICDWRTFLSCFSRKTPKEIFLKYYH